MPGQTDKLKKVFKEKMKKLGIWLRTTTLETRQEYVKARWKVGAERTEAERK